MSISICKMKIGVVHHGVTKENSNANKELRQAKNLTAEKENRGEDRQFRNRNLQDLIRIILIRELLERRRRRPPFGRPPIRPPFLGGGRPPFLGGELRSRKTTD